MTDPVGSVTLPVMDDVCARSAVVTRKENVSPLSSVRTLYPFCQVWRPQLTNGSDRRGADLLEEAFSLCYHNRRTLSNAASICNISFSRAASAGHSTGRQPASPGELLAFGTAPPGNASRRACAADFDCAFQAYVGPHTFAAAAGYPDLVKCSAEIPVPPTRFKLPFRASSNMAISFPWAFLAAPGATGRLMRGLFDNTFAGVHQLAWFDWAMLIPYFTILLILSVYGIHRYDTIRTYFKLR